jgi:hypothetical protein
MEKLLKKKLLQNNGKRWKKMRKVSLFIVCLMLTIVFSNPFLTNNASSHKTLTDMNNAAQNAKEKVSEEKVALLIGIISNLNTNGDTIVFDSENVIAILFNPPGVIQYASGETIIVSGCFGFFGVHFILACGKIQI